MLIVTYTYKEKSLMSGVSSKTSYKVKATLKGSSLEGMMKEGKAETEYSVPVSDSTGAYSLNFNDVKVKEKGKFSGNVVLTLTDSGATYMLMAKGAYNLKKDLVMMTLKGTKSAMSSGISFKIIFDGTAMINTIKTKALGQKRYESGLMISELSLNK